MAVATSLAGTLSAVRTTQAYILITVVISRWVMPSNLAS